MRPQDRVAAVAVDVPAAFPAAMAAQPADRGSSIVQFALVAPLVLSAFLALLDLSTMTLRANAITSGVNDMARVIALKGGEGRGRDADADRRAITLLAQRAGATGAVERVVVYRASGRGAEPPAVCRTGLPAVGHRTCNVYTSGDVEDLAAGAGAVLCNHRKRQFCVGDRDNGRLIGVWVRAEAPSLSGLLPDRTVETYTVVEVDAP